MNRRLFAFATAAALAGCATAQPVETPRAEGRSAIVYATLTLGGADYAVEWYVPAGTPLALMTVQHGFARECANVRGTGLAMADRGLLGLCVNANMAGGNPALAEALATTLLGGATAPGVGQPQRFVVGGHSAGGHFASRLGWALAQQAPARLAGAVLFDPVAANDSFTGNVLAIAAAGQRPVLAVNANPGSCNAQNNADPALRAVAAAGGDGFVGLQLIDRSSHVDVEGRDSNLLGVLPCGRPLRANTDALRTLAGAWAADAATGMRDPAYYPGGSFVQGLVGAGQARPID